MLQVAGGASTPNPEPLKHEPPCPPPQCGWLVTCACLGDSRAVLDTGAEVLSLSVDHRVATHRSERHRLEATGALIAPIDVSGARSLPCSVCS